jgi:hypothetical protein
MASSIVDRLMIERRQVRGKPVRTDRPRFDFNAWMLELDEPSRTRLERFLELAADAIAVGEGPADAVPQSRNGWCPQPYKL